MINLDKRRVEIRDYINWFFNNCNNFNEDSINIFKKLLYARITCMTHEVHITPNKYNSLIKHMDRSEVRIYLKEYADRIINEILEKNNEEVII